MSAPGEYLAVHLKVLALHWLRMRLPDAVLFGELSLGPYGSRSLDVAAVTDDEIVGIEIKGRGDSPARLPLQGERYGAVASRMFLLATPSLEKRCEKARPLGWGRLSLASDGATVVASRAESDLTIGNSAGALLSVLWAPEMRKLAKVAAKAGYAHKLHENLAENMTTPAARKAVCRALIERDWIKGGMYPKREVWRPGDALPEIAIKAEAAE